MWIFFNNAFLSVVDDSNGKANKKNKLLVRARYKGDIERVFPNAIVVETPKKDYRFRAKISRKLVADAIAKSIENIEYCNFKDSIPKDENWFWRHGLYLEVWGSMVQEQYIQEYGHSFNWVDEYHSQKYGRDWTEAKDYENFKASQTPTTVLYKKRSNVDLHNKSTFQMTSKELETFPKNLRFYEQGWNARVDGNPYSAKAAADWRDGWKDCDEAAEINRIRI